MEEVVARAISKGISDGMVQRAAQLPSVAHKPAPSQAKIPKASEARAPSPAPTGLSEVSDQEEPEVEVPVLSEDEEPAAEQATGSALFNPAMFKPLLTKARAAGPQMGLPAPAAKPISDPVTGVVIGPQDPGAGLFNEVPPPLDLVPASQLFLDIIQRQWVQPGTLATPSGTDRKLFTMEAPLEELLKVPQVDDPIMALTSPPSLPAELLEGLKAED
ncbi:PREDICTED: uncharacterized protein LOC106541721, partial [Thamnophis sirtalis]|uniref:Uncharacterized protein LOC106541721 n=1 Tax=Thamnophis sirtalis TaxID=35019 RepID=A0A6I9XPS6_9SAUR